MTTTIIVAASDNNVIGINSKLPWNLPEDMKFFKNTTWGSPVIMGRKTFTSMECNPLPGRMNIVITRQKDWKPEGVLVVESYNDALFVAAGTDSNEAYLIGGGEIFKDLINKVDRLLITRVHAIVDGDVFFPEIDKSRWKLQSKRECKADAKHIYDYTFETWQENK